MGKKQLNWLPHLRDAVPIEAYRSRLTVYLIALEGWRRGLTLKFFSNPSNGSRIRYSLSYKGKEHHFSISSGDDVSEEAKKICRDKHLTKEYLLKAGITVPKGKKFSSEATDDEIIGYSKKELGFPLVLKPTNQFAGRGVFVNIQDSEDLRKALSHVRQDLNYPEVIVEQYIYGKEYRVIVLDNRVIAALRRIPANVIGDGANTIKQLIAMKNKVRRENPHVFSRPIKIDEQTQELIQSAGYTLESIPKKGERIFLKKQSNPSNGGDSIDVTDHLTEEIKNNAVKATKAIPGLTLCGVDLIINQDNDLGVILELNPRPGIGGHLFPAKGKPRDIAKEIVDYYFPETKNKKRSSFYFDFGNVLRPLTNKVANGIIVSSAPLGEIFSKKYIVSGKVQGVGYRNWVRKNALKLGLHGYVKNLENGKVEIVVSGTDIKSVIRFKDRCFQGPKRARVNKVTEHPWDRPVKVGFEIIKKQESKLIKELEKKLRKGEKERRKIEEIKQEYQRILNSRSWRYTQPIRNILKSMKRVFSKSN